MAAPDAPARADDLPAGELRDRRRFYHGFVRLAARSAAAVAVIVVVVLLLLTSGRGH